MNFLSPAYSTVNKFCNTVAKIILVAKSFVVTPLT